MSMNDGLNARAPSANGTLLVVDDDFVQRTIVQKLAEKAGFDTVVASSFEQAAALLAARRFELMTLDLSLGERDGVEMLRLIARLGLTAMPVVVISACEERILNSTRRIAETLGISLKACLAKPLDFGRLREALTERSQAHVRAADSAPKPSIGREALQAALDGREFYAEYQPKIDLRTGAMIGAEALARWRSAQFGRVAPSVFIPLVEKFGMMSAFTGLILESAISHARDFIAIDPRFTLAVNVPGVLMDDLTLPDRIEEILRAHGVAPHALVIEVTEDFAMSNVNRALDILVRLRIKGIGAAIDDFGTGYSSLAALARMPFSELKIDQSFVRRCNDDPDMLKIVEASIGLARAFGMKVVAEGVSSLPVLAKLVSLGCDIGQGYLFSPSLPAERALAWMRDLDSAGADRFAFAFAGDRDRAHARRAPPSAHRETPPAAQA